MIMMKNIFAAVLTFVIATLVGCSTTNIVNGGTSKVDKTYANYEGDLYIPINGEKVSVMHKEFDYDAILDWPEKYVEFQITIEGNKYMQLNITTNTKTTYEFDSNIVEIRYVGSDMSGPKYCYRTEKNEVGTVCKDGIKVFEKGGDHVERSLFYCNEQNNVERIREGDNYLIYYENNLLKGSNIEGDAFYFDNLPYRSRFGLFCGGVRAVGKGIEDCYFLTSCPNAEKDAPIEELIADSGINY